MENLTSFSITFERRIHTMLKLIILSISLGLALSAPHGDNPENNLPRLARPAPINPDVPGDPKPEEKITLIQNDQKHKRDSDDTPKPKPTTIPVPGPVILSEVPQAQSQGHSPHKRENEQKKDTKEDSARDDGVSKVPFIPAAQAANAGKTDQLHKRDIPVPLTLTTQKPTSQNEKQEVNKDLHGLDKDEKPKRETTVKNNDKMASDEHPATFVRPVPVSELFGDKKEPTSGGKQTKT